MVVLPCPYKGKKMEKTNGKSPEKTFLGSTQEVYELSGYEILTRKQREGIKQREAELEEAWVQWELIRARMRLSKYVC